METVKIKLLTTTMLYGNVVGPNDKNNGVYLVNKILAKNLISRQRAVVFNESVKFVEPKQNNINTEDNLKLRTIADELSVQYNQHIGYDKLKLRVLEVIKKQAEELELKLEDIEDISMFYENFKKAKADKESSVTTETEYTEELLREIATEAKIELADGLTNDEIKNIIESELLKYVETLELTIDENDNINDIWNKIKEKLRTDG